MAYEAAKTLDNPVILAGVNASGAAVVERASGYNGRYAQATFTPAAASHTAADVVGGAQEFALGAPAGCMYRITRVSGLINTANAQATGWLLYLFNVTPPSAVADDGAFTFAAGDQASFVTVIALGTAVDRGSTQTLNVTGLMEDVQLAAAGTSLFGYLVNDTTLSTEAVAHYIRIHGHPI